MRVLGFLPYTASGGTELQIEAAFTRSNIVLVKAIGLLA